MPYGLSIKGTFIDPQPSKLQIDIMDLSFAERNSQGDMLIDRKAVKRKLEIEWNQLKNSEISAILQLVQDVFFQATYPDPFTGAMATKTFYVGDRTMPIYNYNNGTPLWSGLKFSLIEQ